MLFEHVEAAFSSAVPETVLLLFTALGGHVVAHVTADLYICISPPAKLSTGSQDTCFVAAEWILECADQGVLLNLTDYDPVLVQARMLLKLDEEHEKEVDAAMSSLRAQIATLDECVSTDTTVSDGSNQYGGKRRQISEEDTGQRDTSSRELQHKRQRTTRLSLVDLPRRSTLQEVKVIKSVKGSKGRVLTVTAADAMTGGRLLSPGPSLSL
ncbi:hypothetical protein BCR37DRAFT_394389 [Protomyces lactucae-debilis]|uniref:BRCT domain-containing protein n=1 Tax=Protomyces lactucae-debilis TaxID=2754530 RepID=A0A1Y2F563_PROLT|nr:uncharacterized protein BCR37DRAFT_394389 [Protomyces lactucae-debilis]ORY79050.1 hypothetical protein BCR37DRAFT_394389 [Protomyces lactucae-debilis]